MSTKKASTSWGISERRIQKLCKDNRIQGAKRFGRSWMIPIYEEKPIDARKKSLINKSTYCSDKRMEVNLFGNEIRKLSENEKCTVYFIENKTGNGIVTYYNVLPGIEVFYNDLHMYDGFTRKYDQNSDVIEINHCRQGRFECLFKTGGYAYLGEGDLAINMLTNSNDTAYFPLSNYHGISIVLNVPEAINTINNQLFLFQDIKLDIKLLQEKIISNNGYFIMRATDTINHIFSELYNVPDQIREGYIKLKTIEFLMFLSTIDVNCQIEKRQYFSKNQVKKTKEIREFLINHLEKRYTLVQLSEMFSFPLTTMKKAFKGIYGTPILSYMREYRLQVAAQMLINSDLSISQISDNVGYENPGKFSETFKKHMKVSPYDYRKKHCLQKEEIGLQD